MEYQQTAIVGAQPLPRLDSLAGSHCLEVDQSLSALSGHCSISGSATLIDYAVTHYGSNTLPMLLDGFQQYDSWDSLIPAVFDVAVDEFEAGWRAHVMKRYAQAPEIKENP